MKIEKTNMKLRLDNIPDINAFSIISAMFEIEPQKDIPVLFRSARYRTSEGWRGLGWHRPGMGLDPEQALLPELLLNARKLLLHNLRILYGFPTLN
jgi:hypothetical protein